MAAEDDVELAVAVHVRDRGHAVGGVDLLGVVELERDLAPAQLAGVVLAELEDLEVGPVSRGRRRDDLRTAEPEHVAEVEVLAPHPRARQPGGDLLEAKRRPSKASA